jgi:hypothetical protein
MKAHGLKTAARVCMLALLVLAALSGTSNAQIAAVGPTVAVATFVVRGTDAAHDPRTNSYLMVGAQGRVVGVCVSASGQPVSGAFDIKPPSPAFGAFPRAAYSPHLNNGAGGFLVVWTQEGGGTVLLHARVVSCSGPTGADQVISAPLTSWIDIGVAALAYSETSQQFLVAWKTQVNPALVVRLVDLNGAPVSGIVQVSAGFGRDPGVAWNPNTNEFGVSFSGETPTNVYSAFVKVPASNPAAFSRTTFNVLPAALRTTITDLAFNSDTNRYLMSWFEISTGAYAKVAEFDANGNLVSQNIASVRVGSYDALSLSFNPVSHTSLLVGVDRATDHVLGAELNANGQRITPIEPRINTSPAPARYTRVATSMTTATWNANWSIGFAAIASQIVATGGAGGGPTPPPQPTTAPKMALDSPRPNTTAPGEGFEIGGWAVDLGAPAGTGVDAVHVWAFPVPAGAPIFVGAARYGVPRADVAAALGSTRFTNSGFVLTGALAAGTYDLRAFAHSALTGTFNDVQSARIAVRPPVSVPRMAVDFPTSGLTQSMNLTITGWAVDLAGGSGTGVDAVHVWAYPVAGGAPIFVGVAAYGFGRADVAAAFSSARFMGSGFALQGQLPQAGDYNLVVFAHSALTRTFNNVAVVRIRVV